MLHLQERRKTKLFTRRDEFGRFVSCLVYLPRDRYNTTVRLRIEAILLEAYGGATIDNTTRVSESTLARLHFVVRMPSGVDIPDVDEGAIERRVIDATRRARAEHRRVVLVTGSAAIERVLAVSGADHLLETTTNPAALD